MSKQKWSILILLSKLAFLSVAGADDATRVSGKPTIIIEEELDQKAIHNLYNNGDFEKVIDVLENFQKSNLKSSFSDSVFLVKHLAVVYTANPETREKGRFYMMRLLDLVPTAKLVDMFVSDEIDRIFERVREEYWVNKKGFGLDTLTRPKRGTSEYGGREDSARSYSNRPFWRRPSTWMFAGIGAATIGALAVLYLHRSGNSDTIPELIVPKENEK